MLCCCEGFIGLVIMFPLVNCCEGAGRFGLENQSGISSGSGAPHLAQGTSSRCFMTLGDAMVRCIRLLFEGHSQDMPCKLFCHSCQPGLNERSAETFFSQDSQS